MSRKTISIVLLLTVMVAFGGCTAKVKEEIQADMVEELPDSDPILITIAAVGDVMAHMPQVNGAWDPEREVYDFSPSFKEIAPYLQAADLTIANLETVLDDSRPYSGYPRFNSPSALAVALLDAGVDIVTTANNHALDQGESGLLNCLDHLDEIGIGHTGTFRNEAERQPLHIDVRGIGLACLAYTTTTNGLPVPKGKDYLVNIWDPDQAEADIRLARRQGADFVIVSIHFGPEYQRYPAQEQKQIARELVEIGADLILGCHPHVVQPWEEQIKPNGEQRVLIIYSLGNFLSNQYFPYTDRGVILKATLIQDPLTKMVSLDSYRLIPTKVLREQHHTIVVDDQPEFPKWPSADEM
ncbi:MAG: CapA family protein [Firmicutes bacterium]|nr:CapA family protein [Bacillota bacterium]